MVVQEIELCQAAIQIPPDVKSDDFQFDFDDLENIHVDAGFERMRIRMEKSDSASSKSSNFSSKYNVKSGVDLNIKRVESLKLDQQKGQYDGQEIKNYYNEYE